MGVKQQTNKSIVLSKNCIYFDVFTSVFRKNEEKIIQSVLIKTTVPECPQGYMKPPQDYCVKIHSASARKRGTLYKCTNADIQMMLEKKSTNSL